MIDVSTNLRSPKFKINKAGVVVVDAALDRDIAAAALQYTLKIIAEDRGAWLSCMRLLWFRGVKSV